MVRCRRPRWHGQLRERAASQHHVVLCTDTARVRRPSPVLGARGRCLCEFDAIASAQRLEDQLPSAPVEPVHYPSAATEHEECQRLRQQ